MRRCRADRWSNDMLRHQADVAHAYQVLKKGGIPDDRIVRFSHSLPDTRGRPALYLAAKSGRCV